MSRPIGIAQPGTPAGPGFDEPFEMLTACHERVGRMLALMDKLRSHMRSHGADDSVRQAARDVMRYFDIAAPQHHRDEELHVFPALLGLQEAELVVLVARLQQDHIQMAARWKAVRSLLEEVAEGARKSFNDADDAIFSGFQNLYELHLQAEESVAFPRASASMDDERLEMMSRDMAGRRGVKQPPPN
jgi:hemerythrin-like domain-containing protein